MRVELIMTLIRMEAVAINCIFGKTVVQIIRILNECQGCIDKSVLSPGHIGITGRAQL